jgi:Dual-action HEIGH metallo-peptidase
MTTNATTITDSTDEGGLMNHIRNVSPGSTIVFAACIALAAGCADRPQESEPHEIIDNLLQAGFPAGDIMVIEGVVYVGRDAEVSLAASREMLEAPGTSQEQYRANNRISTALAKICINAPDFTGVFSTALNLAIQNYHEQPLTFAMSRAPSSDCSYTINAVIDSTMNGGVSGLPSGGLPFHTITIGGLLSGVDVIEHVITHELGHAIGFRHSDYYDRSISCGGSVVDENDDPAVAALGTILIPGTTADATVGGSVMNSCFRSSETGELTSTDITALTRLYGHSSVPNPPSPLTRIGEACAGYNNIYWTAQVGADYYQLYRSSSSSFTSPVLIYSGPNTWEPINVFPEPTWYLRAKACNTFGCSGYSTQVSAKYYTGTCM